LRDLLDHVTDLGADWFSERRAAESSLFALSQSAIRPYTAGG
jgi:hypothetical protein